MKKAIKYAPRIIVSVILLQTLYFKFGIGGIEALNESKEIFGAITEAIFGNQEFESYLRIGTGILELIVCVLILLDASAVYAGLLGMDLMIGAVFSHMLFIGIEVRGDGGQLFIMAFIVLICCAKVAFDDRKKLLALLKG